MAFCDACTELMGELTKTKTALVSAFSMYSAADAESPDKRIYLKRWKEAMEDSDRALAAYRDHHTKSH